ncbi:MAG: Ig-like domain-containing protein [Solirubrobacteraceae bacterium]
MLDASNTTGATVTVSTVTASGLTVNQVALQYAPTGTDDWTLLNLPFKSLALSTAQLSYAVLSAAIGDQDATGVYDIQAVVTDSAGDVGYSPVVSGIVAVDDYGGDVYVGMQTPGTAVSGTINLVAAPWAETTINNFDQPDRGLPDTVTFEISPVGSGNWTPIASVPQELNGAGRPVTITSPPPSPAQLDVYTTALDTATLADGAYDLTVQAENSDGVVFVGNIVSVLIDNTPPTVTLDSPGASLTGVASLSASAQDSGSGLAEVRFEVSPSGSGDWSTIGTESSEPYSLSFDTRGLVNGLYDLRAVATDLAGNVSDSQVFSGVSITNATVPLNPDSLTITDYVVPATNVSLLGAITASSDGETWAYGFTTAPPAIVNGTALTYTTPAYTTQQNGQLVLLEYTDAGGWQIVDVLRNADGSPYQLTSDPAPSDVSGAMTGSGEAWIAVSGSGTLAVFHRAPGGEFLFDAADSTTLQPLGGAAAGFTISLAEESDGTAYGVAFDSNPVTTSETSNGARITVGLQYGVLLSGVWSVQSASLPPGYKAVSQDVVTLDALSPTGAGTGWGVIGVSNVANPKVESRPLFLGSFTPSGWQFVAATGLDALDLTGSFTLDTGLTVTPLAVSADADGVWISASVSGSALGAGSNAVVALYDPATGHVTASWCGNAVLNVSTGCGQPLDANHPATVPDAVFDTPAGTVALGLPSSAGSGSGPGFIDIYAYGTWTSVAASGFSQQLATTGGTQELFTSDGTGWLSGENSMGLITAQPPPSPLAAWPETNENTLTSVALSPAGAGVDTSGALAVGLDGAALHYDATAGWTLDPVPPQARGVDLLGVAFDGPSSAVAVGAFGTILDWNGSTWSADPQSQSLTQIQLNAIAFAPDGQGWAVGADGTILHFDGTAWSLEQIDPEDSGADVTSVTVAGNQVFAVAGASLIAGAIVGGNLITLATDGSWQRVDPSLLPASSPSTGEVTSTPAWANALLLVSGLPDGGVVAAGAGVVLVRQNSSSSFQYSDQPIDGNAVALAAFRDPTTGQVGAFVSVAPIVPDANPLDSAFPSGDGELLMQTSSGGWEDLSQAQYPADTIPGDGAPEPDPVLALAAASNGSAAWIVGGYAGTQTAAGLGSGQPLQSTPVGWQTSSIWRYDAGGSATAPTLTQTQITLVAQPDVVSFAFFSSPMCEVECAQVQDAQPDANLQGAVAEISQFAQQPGGPAFAVLGGNAVGPMNPLAYEAGNGAVDLANIQRYLSGLGSVPLYAAYGPYDAVPTSADPSAPWSAAFAQEPGPFGLGAVPAGITPLSEGGRSGSVNLYYSFDVDQNGGTLMVIVLDNSAGSLEASAPGQTAWLEGQLAAGNAAGLPMVVFCAEPLNTSLLGSATDGNQVAALLASQGVLAVFSTAGGISELDRESNVPYNAQAGAPQLPEYEGASLGYQVSQNDGVLWYLVSVDTDAHVVSVKGIPVVQSLALQPLAGLTVAQSSTLDFSAVGRRPTGTLATTAGSSVPGYENYVSIPASSCSGCIGPSYTFASSIPGIGNFVQPAGPGSLLPLLDANGHPIPSSSSGLFCAFNPGTTIVSVTSGLLTSALPVTVEAGEVGAPCFTVVFPPDVVIETVPGQVIQQTSTSSPGNAVAPTPLPTPIGVFPSLKAIVPPPPPPAPAPVSAPKLATAVVLPTLVLPQALQPLVPTVEASVTPPVVVPPIAPPITPVPPGGATAPAQSTAKREERARRHASQSAYVIRPADTPASEWFFLGVAFVGVIAMLLAAEGLSGPSAGRAELAWEPVYTRRRRKK